MNLSVTVSLVSVCSVVAPALASVLDEGRWPDVVPEFVEVQPRTVNGKYFCGKMVKSPKDIRGSVTNRFLLRRDFILKGKPVEAKVQFVADDGAILSVNGRRVVRNSSWEKPTIADVVRFLDSGTNRMEFVHFNSRSGGGVLAELFVRYADGSYERIDTDSEFRSSIDSGKTWEGVVLQPPPPANPWKWVPKLEYKDFLHEQVFLKGVVETQKPVSGKEISAKFSFKGRVPDLPIVVDARVVKGEGVAWIEERTVGEDCVHVGTDGEWTLDVRFDLPLYLSGGSYDLEVKSGSFFCQDGKPAKVHFTCSQAEIPELARAHVAEVREIAGTPQFHLDGKPFFGLWGSVGALKRPDRLPHHSSAPNSLMTVFADSKIWWPRTDGFDPAVFDRQAELYRRHNGSDAYFIWDITIYPPMDWFDSHPDEVCVDDTGAPVRDGRPAFSLTSDVAIDAMEKAMEKAIGYLERSPYANRIIGYRINSGHTIEWLGWNPPSGREVDFSPAAQKAFARYLRDRNPECKDTRIPTAAERKSSDPAARAKTTAYFDFYSRKVADDVIRLVRRAKELVGGRKLVGTYYGYTMTMHTKGRSQMRAHYALKHLLESGVVDFLMSPQPYSVRRLGDTCGEMKPFATIAANGVVPVIEDDTRTSNGPYNGNNRQTHTKELTVAVIRRNAGIALCRREPVYFYALVEGTEFDFPEFAEDMDLVRKVGEWCLAKKIGRRAEVAYVVSEEDIKKQPFPTVRSKTTGFEVQSYRRNGVVQRERQGMIPGYGDVFCLNYTSLARSGAPVDYVLAEDLADHPGEYKLYIIPDLPSGRIKFRTKTGETVFDTLLRPEQLREAYRGSGVHVYTETFDPVESNDRLFTLHARHAGVKTVRLPVKTTVLDVFNRRIVAKNTDTFTFNAPVLSSWLFYYGDDAEELAAELNR